MEQEGVIKYRFDHTSAQLSPECLHGSATQLVVWRALMRQLGLVGASAERYGGLGFGNLSARVGAREASQGARAFLITGSQTGLLAAFGTEHLALVERYRSRGRGPVSDDGEEVDLVSRGPVSPSSEAITHAAIYDVSTAYRVVFHVHSPDIWRERRALQLPETPESVAYGTAAMAEAMAEICCARGSAQPGVVAMAGHEDGVLAFGSAAEPVGLALVATLARAKEVAS